MKFVRISDKELSKCHKLHADYHSESELYIRNDDVLKILKSIGPRKAKTIEGISEIQDSSFIVPKYGIVRSNQSSVCGYGMKYYNEYITLTKFILNNNLSLEEKRKLAIRLCKILAKLEEYNFIYYDIHSDNILTKEDDIKFLDLDSGLFIENDNIDYNIAIIESKKLLCDLCFQLLLGTDINFCKIEDSKKKRLLGRCCNKEQYDFIEHVLNMTDTYIEPIEYIESLDDEFVEDSKLTLRSKSC